MYSPCYVTTPLSSSTSFSLPLTSSVPTGHFPGTVQLISHVQLFGTPWTGARKAPMSIRFSLQVFWSGLPLPPPGDLPDPGIECSSPALADGFFTTEPPGKTNIES